MPYLPHVKFIVNCTRNHAITSTNLDEQSLFSLITHSVCGAHPFGKLKYFTESKNFKTIVINTIITVLEVVGSLF